jgi:tRNA(Arg) A34 adenosine deaminase TadA
MTGSMQLPSFELRLPDWIVERHAQVRALTGDVERMRFVIELARENVGRRTGGPFAAAVFESESGRIVAVGPNLVTSLRQSAMHAEVIAIMEAQRRVGSYTLDGDVARRHELVTSCEPCAMCYGAILWSGVRRLVCGATKADAEALGFDEGPVDEASYEYMRRRRIEVVRQVERAAAQEVLTVYAAGEGIIYNG